MGEKMRRGGLGAPGLHPLPGRVVILLGGV
jgi:hypothetical protein